MTHATVARDQEGMAWSKTIDTADHNDLRWCMASVVSNGSLEHIASRKPFNPAGSSISSKQVERGSRRSGDETKSHTRERSYTALFKGDNQSDVSHWFRLCMPLQECDVLRIGTRLNSAVLPIRNCRASPLDYN